MMMYSNNFTKARITEKLEAGKDKLEIEEEEKELKKTGEGKEGLKRTGKKKDEGKE